MRKFADIQKLAEKHHGKAGLKKRLAEYDGDKPPKLSTQKDDRWLAAMAKAVSFEPAQIGRSTTITAKPKGGVFGGERLEVTLINLDGQWTIDKISSNARVGP